MVRINTVIYYSCIQMLCFQTLNFRFYIINVKNGLRELYKHLLFEVKNRV